MNVQRTETEVLIIGGGPAGALLGYLLARQGRRVMLAEKERSFERERRGETIAARSVRTLLQLGFGPALERHGYLPLTGLSLREAGRSIVSVDYRRFPIKALPIDIPQPALIATFFQQATTYRNFVLHAGARFAKLLEQDGRVVGALLEPMHGPRIEVTAQLVVGADGRFSDVRTASGLPATVSSAERGFLWFQLPRPEGWGYDAQLVVDGAEHLVILPTFPDHLRVGYSVTTAGVEALRRQGVARFRERIAAIEPRLAPLLLAHLHHFLDTSFSEVFTAELTHWARDGLVLIGDASHTAPPLLGQGLNFAIQDAVLLAPAIAAFFEKGAHGVLPKEALDGFVEKRRAHKQMVTRFHRVQERTLAEHRPLRTLLRRARLRALDLWPLKYHVLDRVLNAPHECDPELGRAAGF